MAQPQDAESEVLTEPVLDVGLSGSSRYADFLRMKQLPLEMFPDPVLPDDGLSRRARS
jgi:hypothetical protein